MYVAIVGHYFKDLDRNKYRLMSVEFIGSYTFKASAMKAAKAKCLPTEMDNKDRAFVYDAIEAPTFYIK